MAESNTPVIVCSADNRYAMPLAVMLRSMVDNLVRYPKVEVWVLDGGVSWLSKRKIIASLPCEKIQLRWIRPSHRQLRGVPVFGHVSICTYYRLLMADLLPEYIHKAIYLDVDILVLGDIGELWNSDLGGHSVLAVAEAGGKVSDQYGLAMYQDLGLDGDAAYFNAGVLVADIDAWRRFELSTKIINFVGRYGSKLNFWDQDILNGLFARSWGELDPKWNVIMHHLTDKAVGMRNCAGAGIIHFASAIKPWAYGAGHVAEQLYFSHIDTTEWCGWRPVKPLIKWDVIRRCLKDKHWYGALIRQIPFVGRMWALLAQWRKS